MVNARRQNFFSHLYTHGWLQNLGNKLVAADCRSPFTSRVQQGASDSLTLLQRVIPCTYRSMGQHRIYLQYPITSPPKNIRSALPKYCTKKDYEKTKDLYANKKEKAYHTYMQLFAVGRRNQHEGGSLARTPRGETLLLGVDARRRGRNHLRLRCGMVRSVSKSNLLQNRETKSSRVMLDKNWMLPYFCGVVGCLSKWPQIRKKNMSEGNDR